MMKEGPVTFLRISTGDIVGSVVACVGEGEVTSDSLKTFGTVGVVKIENLQKLLQFLCKNGFEHHVAIGQSKVSDILFEAMENYLGWDVYFHNGA